jgi:hypothetical protein
MKEYKIAKGRATLVYIVSPILIVLLCLLLQVMLKEDSTHSNRFWMQFIFLALMVIILLKEIIETKTKRFVIEEDRLYIKNFFSYKELVLSEIKGFRFNERYIFIESSDVAKKKLKIETKIEGFDEIKSWLSNNYINLDQKESIEEKEEILTSEKHGQTEEQREDKLKKAKTATQVINWSAGIMIVVFMLFRFKNQYTLIPFLLFPFICLFVYHYFNGLIRMETKKDSPYPSFFIALVIPGIFLFVSSFSNYNIFDYSNKIVPIVIFSILFSAAFLYKNKEFGKVTKYLKMTIFTVFIFLYTFGAYISTNCLFDESKPKIYQATILGKRIVKAKSRMFYLILTPWGPKKVVDEYSVSEEMYDYMNKEDTVTVYFRKGKLGMPWFDIKE